MKLIFANVCLLSVIFMTNCSEIPVLMWSSHSLTDLISPLAGHTIKQDNFKNDYLDKLICKDCQKHTLVAFVQDKLSLDDITRHGNVYVGNSNGGAFPHIKNYMEKLPSLTLSSVKNPNEAVLKLKDVFQGRVHQLKPGQSVKELKLIGRNLILYDLTETGHEVTAAQMVNNDKHISNVIGDLEELGVPFTALYTAKQPSMVKNQWFDVNMGRRLLATPADKPDNTIHVNVSGCMLYAQQMSISASKNSSNTILSGSPKTDGSKCDNSTGVLKLTWEKQGGLNNVVVQMNFAYLKQLQIWIVANLTLTAKGKINDTDVNEDNVKLDTKNMYAPKGRSYHCFPDMKFAGLKEGNKSVDAITLIFKGIQIQPDVKRGRFGPANDCIGFFTIPIFSGLIVAFILIAILTYGIAMIANISTQDRFDDPKSKPLNVHVPEHDK